MPVETASLKQRAVLYPFIGFDGAGNVSVGDPVEIKARWEDNDQERQDPTTSPHGHTTTVYVDRDIDIGSKLWLGKLDDLPDDLDTSRLKQVVGVEKIPDVRGRVFQRTVTLN